jgi:hypothetical protein
MTTQRQPTVAQKEGRVLLASQAINLNQIKSVRRAAELFDVPRSLLRRRLQGCQPPSTINARKRRLLTTEEQSLVQWILELDRRGFPPHIIDVRQMGDALLAARGQQPPPPPLGKNWVSRFVKAQSELQTKWNRKFHSQRAKCEDPIKINAWYSLVRDTIETYGILPEDTYNFDETCEEACRG